MKYINFKAVRWRLFRERDLNGKWRLCLRMKSPSRPFTWSFTANRYKSSTKDGL